VLSTREQIRSTCSLRELRSGVSSASLHSRRRKPHVRSSRRSSRRLRATSSGADRSAAGHDARNPFHKPYGCRSAPVAPCRPGIAAIPGRLADNGEPCAGRGRNSRAGLLPQSGGDGARRMALRRHPPHDRRRRSLFSHPVRAFGPHIVAGGAAPGHGAPRDRAPGDRTPGNGSPGCGSPGDRAPGSAPPRRRAPGGRAPGG
jgi:hypothetical protein